LIVETVEEEESDNEESTNAILQASQLEIHAERMEAARAPPPPEANGKRRSFLWRLELYSIWNFPSKPLPKSFDDQIQDSLETVGYIQVVPWSSFQWAISTQ